MKLDLKLDKKLTKCAAFTDIHWGAKNNSRQHNEDNLNYIRWFCEYVKSHPEIDHINFLGDWFENRNAINTETLQLSYEGAKMLSELGLPIFFLVGNHDLYHRAERTVYAPVVFDKLDNFHVIDEPVEVEATLTPSFYTPFLFSNEYPDILQQFGHLSTWWGHFEFKDFVITGYSVKMLEGPDIKDYKSINKIFSGHYHKRQSQGNTHYIGNTFPTNFADVGDNNRGLSVYDYETDTISYENWKDCPKYIKCNLSNVIDGTVTFYPEARVKCIIDIEHDYDEMMKLRETTIETNSLREFAFEESVTLAESIAEEENVLEVDEDLRELESTEINNIVLTMIRRIDNDTIDNALLEEIYLGLN